MYTGPLPAQVRFRVSPNRHLRAKETLQSPVPPRLGESLLAETGFQKPIGRRSSCLKKSISKRKVIFNLGVFVKKRRYLPMQTRF